VDKKRFMSQVVCPVRSRLRAVNRRPEVKACRDLAELLESWQHAYADSRDQQHWVRRIAAIRTMFPDVDETVRLRSEAEVNRRIREMGEEELSRRAKAYADDRAKERQTRQNNINLHKRIDGLLRECKNRP